MQNIIIKICEQDTVMQQIVKKVGECKIKSNTQSIFSYLVGLIIGQKIRFATARKIRGFLYEETKSYNFTPNDILNLNEHQWKKIGVGNMQKEKIIRISNYFLNNHLNLNNVTKNDIEPLTNINGIGEWTILTLLIEYGLDLNLFPLNDKHVNKQLKKYYNIDECNIKNFVEKWNPYKSVAFWYLWKNELE